MSDRPTPRSLGYGASGKRTDMTTDQALEIARRIVESDPDGTASLSQEQRAAVRLARKVITMRQAETDVAAAWGQHHDNPHIPDELRRALDALTEQRTS